MPDIRIASASDATSIAYMHATSWKDAYKNILPEDYLNNNLEGERMTHWNRKMSELTGNDFVLIAEENNEPAGFISVWETNDEGYDALVDNLHVLPAEKGKGTGLKLILSATEKLVALNKRSFYLWVFDQNVPARRFYEKIGGQAKDKKFYEVSGFRIPETRFVWTNLAQLLARHSDKK